MPVRQPSQEEVLRALEAGYASIDEGEGFYAGFGTYLTAAGYRKRPEAPCTCIDRVAHGHLPECGWTAA